MFYLMLSLGSEAEWRMILKRKDRKGEEFGRAAVVAHSLPSGPQLKELIEVQQLSLCGATYEFDSC